MWKPLSIIATVAALAACADAGEDTTMDTGLLGSPPATAPAPTDTMGGMMMDSAAHDSMMRDSMMRDSMMRDTTP